MEKSKRVLIVLIILIVMIAIIGIMLLNINKKPETIKGNTQSTTNNDVQEAFTKVNDYKTYFTVKEIVDNYITYMKQINGDEYVDASSLQMLATQISKVMQEDGLEALKGILDESYLKDVSDNSLIKMQDTYKQDGTYTKQISYNINIDGMYQSKLASDISIVLVEAKIDNKE